MMHLSNRTNHELLGEVLYLMIELVLSDVVSEPVVEKLAGPRVRLSIHPSHDLARALLTCRDQLHDAIDWALTSLYSNDEAPDRVFVRDANGQEMVTLIDPCSTYGSQAIIRP